MNATTTAFPDESRRARAAQAEWVLGTIAQRLQPVRELRRLLVERRDAFAMLIEQEVGKRRDESIPQDLTPSADALRFLERRAARILAPQRVRHDRPIYLWGQADTIYRRPHGVTGIIGTWNYPLFLNVGPMAQALTAGNAVLWKPSEIVPRTAALLHQTFLDAGYPPALLQCLPSTREAGPQLLEADIDHLVFTGSGSVGRTIAKRLGERLIPSTLELSGCDAFWVLPDADLDLAATAAWFGVLLNHGQTCMAARRLFIAEAVYEPFLERLKSLMDAAEVQHLVMPASVEQAGRAIADAQERGGQLVCGMPAPTGSSMLPTIVLNATPEMIICREPSFAPIAAVMSFSDQEMALQMEAQCPYALAASIFTRDIRSAERLAARLRPGAVCINDVVAPTAHPATPFGGRGASGWGVTQGAEGLLGMTVPQVVSTRTDTFRPYYTIGSMPEPGMPDVVEGAFIWQHARTFGERWRGLRQMLRGMWQMSRK